MNAFLAAQHSLALTRIARQDPGLVLLPDAASHRENDRPPNVGALRGVLPPELSGFDKDHPIALTAFSRATRSQSKLVEARTLLSELPDGSFMQVAHADGSPWAQLDGKPVRLFVESPGLSLVRMCQQMSGLVASGYLSDEVAFAQLLAFPMEACGLYARDPLDPRSGPCAYDIKPLIDEDALRNYLEELRDVRGVKLARRVALYAKNGSGSPAETLLSLVMRLAPERGGVPLPYFVENQPIVWPDNARGVVKHRTMRPDFYWPEHWTASEYNGGVHGTGSSFVEDAYRAQDYGACGIELVPATFEDIRAVDALGRYLTLLARKLARFEDAGFLARTQAIIADPRGRAERKVLLAQLLPPLGRSD